MKNTQIIILVVILAIIGLAIGLTKKGAVENEQSSVEQTVTVQNTSVISIENSSHDFGEIDIFAGKVSADFVLTNSGDQDVVVTKATTSCGCTEGEIEGKKFGMHFGLPSSVTIPAGESRTVTGIYDPLAHGPNATGPVTRMLLLETNSTATPSIELRLSADVIKN